MKGIKQADWIAAAREFLAELPEDELQAATVWKVMDCFRIGNHEVAERLIIEAQLRRGLVSLSELRPELRRKMIDPTNLNLSAIASGPIMDPGTIYLPAGKLSMAETRARENASILPNEGEANGRG